jgi:uncharacterized protein (DUF2147 family)
MTTVPKLCSRSELRAWRIVAAPLTTSVSAAIALSAAALCSGLTPSAYAAAPAQPGVQGVWIDAKGEGAVEIAPCGEKLCGKIVWVKDPNDKNGQPLVDLLNPEPSKKKRPICGLPIIGDLKRQPDGSWDTGWIYDPNEGKSYDLEVTAKSADRIQIKGYMGMKFLSETFVWTRAPATLQRCK